MNTLKFLSGLITGSFAVLVVTLVVSLLFPPIAIITSVVFIALAMEFPKYKIGTFISVLCVFLASLAGYYGGAIEQVFHTKGILVPLHLAAYSVLIVILFITSKKHNWI